MKLYILILLILIFLVCLYIVFRKILCKRKFWPKIIHLIYFPWHSSTQTLKDDPFDFDHTWYKTIKKDNPNYDVKLWTLPKSREFVRKYYPFFEKDIFNVSRLVMMIDILRILVVYHYGGIYFQYGSKILKSMNQFLPNNNYSVKLFTETIISEEVSNKMKLEPIRNGKPEELLRVAFAVFSAVPKHPYMLELFKTVIENVRLYPIRSDYDILYTTGNAMMSTVYDKIGKYRSDIELIGLKESNKMFSANSQGSWRTDKFPA